MQKARSKLEAAKAAAALRVRSENNRRQLVQAGKDVTALSVTQGRLAESATQGSVRQQIIASEQLGALNVAAAAAGQGGSSVRLIKLAMERTVAETAARREVAESRELDALTGQQGDALFNAVTGQDYSYQPTQLDFTPHFKPGNAGIVSAAFSAITGSAQAGAFDKAKAPPTPGAFNMTSSPNQPAYGQAARDSINSIGTYKPVRI
jgi:hypothetical protein